MRETDWTFGFTGERIEVIRKKGRKICSVESTVYCNRQNVENLHREVQVLPHLFGAAKHHVSRRSDLDTLFADCDGQQSFASDFQRSLQGALKECQTSRRVQPLLLEQQPPLRKLTSRKHRL